MTAMDKAIAHLISRMNLEDWEMDVDVTDMYSYTISSDGFLELFAPDGTIFTAQLVEVSR